MIVARVLPPIAMVVVFVASALALRPPPTTERPRRAPIVCGFGPAPRVDPPPPPAVVVDQHHRRLAIIDAVSLAHGDVEGCLMEWNEREPGDATLLVHMTIRADGRGRSTTTAGPDSPPLRMCVEAAIDRVRFPTGPEAFELDVTVQWEAGIVGVSARIAAVSHRTERDESRALLPASVVN